MIKMIVTAALAACIVSGISATAGFAVAHERWDSAEAAHLSTRTKVILSQAQQRNWKTVVIGDSMAELAMLNEVCGDAALNAGIAGAQTSQLVGLADALLKVAKPKLIVIAVGTNDSRVGDPTSAEDFSRSYRALIKVARTSGAKVTLLDIPPRGRFGKAALFNSDLIAEHNRQIHGFGLPVANTWSDMADGAGLMPNALTDDGVHPNARGYLRWISNLQKTACQ